MGTVINDTSDYTNSKRVDLYHSKNRTILRIVVKTLWYRHSKEWQETADFDLSKQEAIALRDELNKFIGE